MLSHEDRMGNMDLMGGGSLGPSAGSSSSLPVEGATGGGGGGMPLPPEGFEYPLPQHRLDVRWQHCWFKSLQHVYGGRRYAAKCVFCGYELEGRPDRMEKHVVASCTKIPLSAQQSYVMEIERCSRKRDGTGREKSEEVLGPTNKKARSAAAENSNSMMVFQNGTNNNTSNTNTANNDNLGSNPPIAIGKRNIEEFVAELSIHSNWEGSNKPFMTCLKRLLEFVDDDIAFPSHDKLVHKVLPELYRGSANIISDVLGADRNWSIQLDCMILANSDVRFLLLACNQKHTQLLSVFDLAFDHCSNKEHIHSMVHASLAKLQIRHSAFLCTMTLAPSSQLPFLIDMQSNHVQWFSIPCVLRGLQALIRRALYVIIPSLRYMKIVLSSVYQSPMLLSKLKSVLDFHGHGTPTSLELSVQPWMSLFFYLKAGLSICMGTREVILSNQGGNLKVSNEVINSIHNIDYASCKFVLGSLQPIKQCIHSYIDHAEKKCLGDVPLMLIKLSIEVSRMEFPRSSTTYDFRGNIMQSISSLQRTLCTELHLLCFFLWPKFKAVAVSKKWDISSMTRVMINVLSMIGTYEEQQKFIILETFNAYYAGSHPFVFTDEELNMNPVDFWRQFRSDHNHLFLEFVKKLFNVIPHSHESCKSLIRLKDVPIRRTEDLEMILPFLHANCFNSNKMGAECMYSVSFDWVERELSEIIFEIEMSSASNLNLNHDDNIFDHRAYINLQDSRQILQEATDIDPTFTTNDNFQSTMHGNHSNATQIQQSAVLASSAATSENDMLFTFSNQQQSLVDN